MTSTLPVFETFVPGRAPLDARVLDAMLPQARTAYLEQRARISDTAAKSYGPDLFRKEMEFERAFSKAGGLLLAGLDPTGYGGVIAGFGDQREVELLVEAGFTPVEAIHIASSNGAEFLGQLSTIGTLAPGKAADIVVLRGDPSTNIKDIENVAIVFKDGVGYDSDKSDSVGARTRRFAVTMSDIDHLILGINSLSDGIERFAALTGVTPVRGGQHPGRGTENALVSLGPGRYLEILSEIAPGSNTSGYGATHHAELTLVGWALQCRSLTEVVAGVRAAGFAMADPKSGSRRTPDGTLLQWRAARVTEPGFERAPFFIEWDAHTTHPSRAAPDGCRLVSFELLHPDSARVRSFFTAADYHVTVQTNDVPGMRTVIDSPGGRVTFSSQ